MSTDFLIKRKKKKKKINNDLAVFGCIMTLFFPSIGFSCESFPLYQVFILSLYLSLVQNSLDFLFLFFDYD